MCDQDLVCTFGTKGYRGTDDYAAPELSTCRQPRMTPECDMYSLGRTLLQLLGWVRLGRCGWYLPLELYGKLENSSWTRILRRVLTPVDS